MNTTSNSRATAVPGASTIGDTGIIDRPRGGLDAKTPLLLLPVNIETRFMSGGNEDELWVRIYPDQIAINSHEPELTAQEIADGQGYWNAVWSAGLPPASLDTIQAPWRGLASLYGSPRAAWIALELTPTNLAAQPTAATPAGAAPVPAPVFPTPPTRDSSWQKPALAAALPDAWTVVLVSGAATSTFRGSPITPGLAVGLTPGAGAFPPGSPVDTNLQWLVDFNQALAVGMALKIPLTAAQRTAGFDRLFVYGLRSKGTAGEFAALLGAHHYTDGFALVPQGSPTNNTADASSAFSSKDPTYDISFAVEREAPLNTVSTSDGSIFASLLGLPPEPLAHVRYAGGTDQGNSTDSVTALWASTLGYFLAQMMSGVFTTEQIEDARQYVIANTSPRGAVPAFRVGQTPYGVLPVTSLRRYESAQTPGRAAAPSIEAPLVAFIQRLWPVWLQSSGTAPHMANTGDPDAQLLSVLGMDASSMAFRGRTVLGDDFLWNYLSFIRTPASSQQSWWNSHLVAGRQALDSFGYNSWDPRVIHLGMAPSSFPVPYPTVQTAPLSETDPLASDADLGGGLKGNYIQWIRHAAIDDLRAENYPGPKPTSLLYKILRQSMLLDYVTLASVSEIGAGRLVASQVRELEVVSIAPAQPAPQPPVSSWEILARPSEPNPALTWAQYLVTVDPPPESPFARLAELRGSLDRLSTLPTAELDRLLTEFLDACSHRLDVWASTIANALLLRTRDSQVTETHLGAFGWLEEVRPAAVPAAPVVGAELTGVQAMDRLRSERIHATSALPVPVQPMVDNGGFIFAPSFEQARTAAILRNGYMTHKGTANEGLLSLDISSDRVRKALYLLDGVRQGQNLSALLGYLFESGLHDLHLDLYTQPFRDRFPVVANQLTPSSDPSEAVAASNVVDGVALTTAYEQGVLAAGGNWGAGLPPAGTDQTSVLNLLKAIEDYSDALGDVSMAEAVFQIVRGNFGRAGGLIDAISRGDRPPDPDIITTPRGGLDLTHRVTLLFAGTPSLSPPWSAITTNPRAGAEPWLDAWLSHVLPDPAQVVCTVQYSLGGTVHSSAVRLSDLDVGPLDCLSMADSAQVPQQSELEARIYAFAAPPSAAAAQIDYIAPPGSIAFPDFFFLVSSLQSLIGSARALAPQDLTVPEKVAADLGGAVDLTDLRTRASNAAQQLASAVAALSAAIGGSPAALRSALGSSSLFGLPNSVPSSITDATLADQAAAVLKSLQPRSTQASAVNTATASQADLLSVFSFVFGAGFTVLPRFTPPDAASLQAAFTQSASLVASDPVAPARWLNQLTHIRPAISRLDTALSLAQILGATVRSSAPLLAQLPLQPGDRWLGLAIDPSHPPDKGRVAFACITEGDPVTASPFAGLLLDEWPERIPSTDEKAAVAFHYERPKARAPQSLLLALCPDDRAAWDDDLIAGILEETLELAKIRTVDLDSVLRVGQILPALYFALNLQGATVSANFTLFKETSVHATSILH